MTRAILYPIKAEPPPYFGPEAVSLDKWQQPLAMPVRRTAFAAALFAAGAAFVPVVAAPAETITLDKWHRPLSEPVRVKRALPAALQDCFEIDAKALTQPEAPGLDKWYRPLGVPRELRRLGLPPALQQAFVVDSLALTRPEAVSLDKWQQPLSLPRWARPSLRQAPWAIEPPYGFIPPETVTLDKWHRPLAEPVRVPRRLHAALNEDWFGDAKALTQPEATSLDRWYQPLGTPVRRGPPPTFATPVPNAVFPAVVAETVTLDKWYQPLALPRGRVAPAQQPLQQLPPQPNPAEAFAGWFAPLAEPVPPRRGQSARLQAAFVMDWQWNAPPAPTYGLAILALGDSTPASATVADSAIATLTLRGAP